jgi:hypothetical protein
MAQGSGSASGAREGSNPALRLGLGGAIETSLGRIEKNYVFDGLAGKLTLSDLFQGRSQVY